MGLIIIIGWTLRQPQVYEDWFGQTVIYYPLVPALPYLAVFAFLLSCLCFVFGYLEREREVKRQAAERIGKKNAEEMF